MKTTPRRIEIAPFPAGKRLAVTTSWDDGRVYDRRLVAAFNQWGLKGTFNLNSSRLHRGAPPPEDSKGNLAASEIAALFAGHEVAIHTVTHPWLDRLDGPQIATEVLDDRKALEDLVGYPVRGCAYPFNSYNQRVIEVLRQLGIVYARCGQVSDQCFPPAEPLAWPSSGHMYRPDLLNRWETLYQNQRAWGQVFFVWGHSYEFADRNDWAGLERIFKPLAGKPDVWYCTNIELFDYEAARQRIVIAANRKSAYNPSAISVWLNVDGKSVEVLPGKVTALQ
jgi:peptidoglycan/xylan/chitin deacetylase (PgdA/CDA1 family)